MSRARNSALDSDAQADLFATPEPAPADPAEPDDTAAASPAAAGSPPAVTTGQADDAPPTQAGAAPRVARPDYALAGRNFVITGAAQGIGAACARLLVEQGAQLALWDIQQEAAQALAAELNAAPGFFRGGHCHALRCDVSDKASVDAALARTQHLLGRLDGVVCNAGIFRAAPFLEVSEADWDKVIATNLKGSFLVSQACARAMVAAGRGGAIVLMSSVNGVMAIPEIASYNASKGGIDQLTRAAALALADHAIRVNAVAPGTIATELAAAAVLTSEAARRRILGRTPMKRLGEPAEVAEVVAFLLSESARYMTGEVVYVDGGRRALNYSVQIDSPA
ncbi:MAG: hypothetical protein RIQ60_2673 [Pseudomonadota bacterium]|jgi:NAD(P)-dependent dehydrogenase (short-subunit alcohol dehydrogenase family)